MLMGAYAIPFDKEIRGENHQDLHAQLEALGEDDAQVLAAAAAIAQAVEVGAPTNGCRCRRRASWISFV